MSFKEIFSSKERVLSFEFFPPKEVDQLAKTKDTISSYAEFAPDFMTVTYGAGGGTRELTRDLTAFIAKELSLPAVAHLTCVGSSRSEINDVLDDLKEQGISHVLALRGDPPAVADGERAVFWPHPEGFSCARDLAAHIRARGDFSIAVAGYPEGHPDANSREVEFQYLKEKVACGGEVIITQLFFDSDHYFRFVSEARAFGITTPILPGVMPIANVDQVKRFTKLCGATIPERMSRELDELSEFPARVREYGISAAYALSRSLLDGGAPGIHFYTLNRSVQVAEVYGRLKGDGYFS